MGSKKILGYGVLGPTVDHLQSVLENSLMLELPWEKSAFAKYLFLILFIFLNHSEDNTRVIYYHIEAFTLTGKDGIKRIQCSRCIKTSCTKTGFLGWMIQS